MPHETEHGSHTQIAYSGGRRYTYRCRLIMVWIVASIVNFILCFFILLVLAYRKFPSYHANYRPTDTRIIAVNNLFCQSLEMTVLDQHISDNYTVSLSMLNSPPKLTGSETFSYKGTRDFESEDEGFFRDYYMYPGSNFTVSLCISENDNFGVATFSLIKSVNTFKQWNNSHRSHKEDFKIESYCGNDSRTNATYHIEQEDYYYLVIEADSHMQLSYIVTGHRTQYEAGDISTADSCSVTETIGDSCSVRVPLSTTALLVVTPPPDTKIQWTKWIFLRTSCASKRVWMYVVVFFSAFTISLLLIIACIMACVSVIMIRRRKKATPTVTAADNAPLL